MIQKKPKTKTIVKVETFAKYKKLEPDRTNNPDTRFDLRIDVAPPAAPIKEESTA
jgi:hypothetical protein